MTKFKITTAPHSDPFGNTIIVDPSKKPEIVTFFGDCHAVRLVQRGDKDKHICYEFLCEDDGHWFLDNGGGSSSSWFPEFIAICQKAQKWMESKSNAIPDISHGRQYGYKLK